MCVLVENGGEDEKQRNFWCQSDGTSMLQFVPNESWHVFVCRSVWPPWACDEHGKKVQKGNSHKRCMLPQLGEGRATTDVGTMLLNHPSDFTDVINNNQSAHFAVDWSMPELEKMDQ